MYKFTVIGNPIKHSLSPNIHSIFANQTDLKVAYSKTLLTAEQLPGFLSTKIATLNGFNITTPFKDAAFSYLSKDGFTADALSQQSRASNTVDVRQKTLFNTDGIGLVNDLSHCFGQTSQKNILILGCGGAAQGILPSLLERQPQSLVLWNRTADKATTLANKYQPQAPVFTYQVFNPTHFDIVINATSSSLQSRAEQPLPFLKYVSHETFFYDLMYSIKSKTAFIQALEKQKLTNHSDGLGMLIEQAAASFKVWTGLPVETQGVCDQLRQCFM